MNNNSNSEYINSVLPQGTKIVCINNKRINGKDYIYKLNIGDIYVIENDSMSQSWCGYEINGSYYDPDRFITLDRWRKDRIRNFLNYL